MTSTITCASCTHAYADTALFCPNCGRPKVRDAVGDPLLGKVLGERFQVQAQLGQGGSGTIYRAEHITLRRKVAIKVLHDELSRDDLAVERFRREATTVAEIDNEHIVEIHDFGRTPDGRLYLAMELLDGETLDAVLVRDRTLSIERVADVLIQVGEALMEAHAIGYVHRDLRPRNVYLAIRRGKANFVKLLDFGLAKLVETDASAASTSLGMTFGDPRYMSPEQARGDRIDRRADIYQLGCVAYEMLTGAPPFGGNRVFDILSKQVTEAPQPLPTRRPGVPLWMEAAVAKMLAKDPANRFATTTRMVEALRRGLETGEVMDDDVARRRESIPPPSVSRVMQRMGLAPGVDGAAPPAPSFQPTQTTRGHATDEPPPAAAQPTVTARGHQPELPSTPPPPHPPEPVKPRTESGVLLGDRLPADDPGRTSQGVAVPTPRVEPVEPLRRRTGTPRLGVPIVPAGPGVAAPAVRAEPGSGPVAGPVVAAAARAELGAVPGASPARAEPSSPPSEDPSQAPVAGVIEPSPVRAPPSPAPTSPETTAAPAGRKRAADGIGISQVWYEDGDRASEEAETSSIARARKVISPSAADLSSYDSYDEEPRRRRWGLIIGGSGVLVVGGLALALGLGRGGPSASSPPPPEPAIAAPSVTVDAAPSTIIDQPEPAPAVAVVPDAAVVAATTTKPVDRKSGSEPARVELRKPAELGAFAPTEPVFRRPGGDLGARPPGDPVPIKDPGTGNGSGSLGVSGRDRPEDPYNTGEPAPVNGGTISGATIDSASADKRAEFFANLGTQQLIGGDAANAAANFKKALELDPRSANATIGMGEIALRQGLFGDAIAHLKKAARIAPKSGRVFTLLGEAYLALGQHGEAAANFKKALQNDPDNQRARDGYNDASSRAPAPTDE